MATARLLQSNFASGELSDRIRASGDLERYAGGAERIVNAHVLPLGALQRRGGTVWVADPAAHADGRLLPFWRSVGDAVAVFVQDETLRFIDVSARDYLRDEAEDPIEIACPWGEGDYAHLFTWQSADVLWIGDRRGTAPVKVLRRVDGVWQALADLELRNGPFLPDTRVSLTFSDTIGAVSLTAASAIFEAGHVGALLGVRQNTGAPPVNQWISDDVTDVASGDLRYNAGRVYGATNNTSGCGTNSPIHDEGIVNDGRVLWEFLHDGLGIVRITSFTDDMNAGGIVQRRLPFAGGDLSSIYWGLSAFSDAAGWPTAGAVHQERFVLGGAQQNPDTTYLSRVSGYGPAYADFKAGLGTGLVTDQDAVRRTFASGVVQQILHYVSSERLYAFTASAVYVIGGPSVEEAITPSDAAARERCGFGAAADVAPVKTGDSIMFVTQGREEIREIVRDSVDTPNVSVLADHICGRGVAELAFQAAPLPLLWSRLDDGGLASMTYERLERVRAWAQHQIGGAAEVVSAIVLPEPDGRQALWLYLKRVIDGAVRYAIEILPPAWRRLREPLEMACCLDAAGYFDFWNSDAADRARLTAVDAEAQFYALETELDTFSAGDVGKRFAVRKAAPKAGFDPGADAALWRLDVLEYVNAKLVRGRVITQGAADLVGAWSVHWARMQSVLEVGARLEGCAVDVLGDGNKQMDLAVAGGDVALTEPVARGWVGLRAPFELLDLPIAQGSPLGAAFGARKAIERLWVVSSAASAGMSVFNPDTGEEDALVFRAPEDPTEREIAPRNGFLALVPKGHWSDTGQIGVRQIAPYPCDVLGIVKEVSVG